MSNPGWNHTCRTSLKRKRSVKTICCIGGGYVGGPSAAVIAEKMPHLRVIVADLDEKRVAAWNSDQLPVYEPGLYDIVKRARDGLAHQQREPNLFFTTNIDEAISEAQLVFVGVNTPAKRTGLGAGKASDLGWLEAATRRIARSAIQDTIVVEKSTVPCGTADNMREILRTNAKPGVHFDVLSNPEFLAEGTAISNLLRPDRILIGCAQTAAGFSSAYQLADIYSAWVPRDKIITMNLWSSELSKLAANAMLAQRISSINALSSICEAVSANIQDVAFACGLDSRIGPKMLNASVGFGGSCFRKDLLNLIYISESLGLTEVASYWNSVLQVNEHQKHRFTNRIVKALHANLSYKRIAVMGFAYKKDTGDTRESPAITVVNNLLAENATIAIYDPKVQRQQILQDLTPQPHEIERLQICEDPYEACQDAHAVVILTEWDMFSNRESRAGQLKALESVCSPMNQQSDIRLNHIQESEALVHRPTSPRLNGADSENESTSIFSYTSDSHSSFSSASSTESILALHTIESPVTTHKERLDWSRIAKVMQRPMYVFDGRNIMDVGSLEKLGFRVEAIGVPSSTGRGE